MRDAKDWSKTMFIVGFSKALHEVLARLQSMYFQVRWPQCAAVSCLIILVLLLLAQVFNWRSNPSLSPKSELESRARTENLTFEQLGTQSVPFIMNAYEESDFGYKSTNQTHLKYILMWNDAYGSKEYGIGFGTRGFEHCPVPSCFATDNRTWFQHVGEFDAILFHLRTFNEQDYPETRKPRQRYIFWSLESPQYNMRDVEPLNNRFNWTMTYKTNSDILLPYGWIQQRDRANLKQTNTLDFSQKTKLVAWFVSNCKSHSQRESYVKSLQKHVQVDIYGSCGTLQCSQMTQEACYKMLERDYKFYLSLENSYCDDYVTEKFFTIMQLDIIPIVWGGANYSSLAPPHSYIDLHDFPTANVLGQYLNYLSQNTTAYREYFWWKPYYRVRNDQPDLRLSMCGLCARLHVDPQTKMYEDMEQWWTRKSHCHDPRPNNVFGLPFWDPET